MADLVIALFDYNATSNFGTPFRAGEVFTLLEKSNAEWSKVMRNDRSVIYVPANYVEEFNPPSTSSNTQGSFPNGDLETGQLLHHAKAPNGSSTLVGNTSDTMDGFESPGSNIVKTRKAHSVKTSSLSKVPVSHRMSLPVNQLQPPANLPNRRFSSHVNVSPPLSPTPDAPLSTTLTEEGRAVHELRSDVAGIDQARTEGVAGPRMSGYLSRKGICGAGGKKMGHRWAQFYCVLIDNHLNFFKDRKNAQNLRNNTLPLHTFPLHGSAIAAVQEHRKKHVFQLTASKGEVIYCQAENQIQYDSWTSAISDVLDSAISLAVPVGGNSVDLGRSGSMGAGPDTPTWEYVTDIPELQEDSEVTEKGRIKRRLVHFFSRRPPPEAIAGLVKDQYFGVALQRLCDREKRYVPTFVEQCIGAIEQRGLDLVGIYRLSGNASQVQKLRYMVDHDEPLEQIFVKVEDVNILTGALKLFLRDLPEPIIPFNLFDMFISASKVQELEERLHAFADSLRKLPTTNFFTLKTLCAHLLRVTELGHVNKMQIANIAIVFGPTLMRPQVETMSMAIDLVHQSNVVEHFLREYNTLFPDH